MSASPSDETLEKGPRDLNQALASARSTIRELQEELEVTNRGLLALSMELEDRVALRTRELEQSNLELKRALREKEKAEKEIQELARLTAQNPHPVLRVDQEGKVLYANQASVPVLNLWGGWINGYVSDEWRDFIAGVYRNGANNNLELQCTGPTFSVTFSPVADAGHVNIYAHEITERKKAEESLKWELGLNTSLARLSREIFSQEAGIEDVAEKVLAYAKSLTGSSHGLVSSLDPQTGENVCHTLTAMMEDQCQVSGPDRRIAFSPREDGRYPALWGHCLNTRQGFFTNNPAEHVEAGGLPPGHIPVERFLSVPVLLGDQLAGQIAVANPSQNFQDKDLEAITRLAIFYALALDRHRSTQEKIMLERNLRQAQKLEAAGTLAGGIAHDFNNILAAMIGYVNLTMHQLEAGSLARRNLEMVIKASLRAKNLIKQILAFSRQTEKEARPLNISPIIKEALKLVRASIPSTIEITRDIAPEPGNILGDPSQMHQIMMNLCTNAAHAMADQGGTLNVSLGRRFLNSLQAGLKPGLRPGAYVCLSVSDTGLGIPPAIMDRIFEPYFTTKESHEGTGLGLSVVHGIVKSIGGDITVYSEPGRGTTFNLLFPTISQDTEEEIEDHRLILGKGERLLFVDDEALLVDVATQMLPKLGYSVAGFSSSPDALAAFKQTPDAFDLVITDYTMPKMIGTQLALEIRKVRQDIPIIMCTGFAQNLSDHNRIKYGIEAILLKPLYEHELSQVLRQVLDKETAK